MKLEKRRSDQKEETTYFIMADKRRWNKKNEHKKEEWIENKDTEVLLSKCYSANIALISIISAYYTDQCKIAMRQGRISAE